MAGLRSTYRVCYTLPPGVGIVSGILQNESKKQKEAAKIYRWEPEVGRVEM